MSVNKKKQKKKNVIHRYSRDTYKNLDSYQVTDLRIKASRGSLKQESPENVKCICYYYKNHYKHQNNCKQILNGKN